MKHLCVLAACLWASSWAAAATFEEGLELKKAGRLAEAERVFAGLVRAQPMDADALEQLATVQGWLGRTHESIRTWLRAVHLSPKNPDYLLGLARAVYWSHDNRRALGLVGKVLDESPRDADALVLKGDILLASEDPDGARAAYVAARSLSPDDPEIEKKLARIVPQPRFRVDTGYLYDHYGNFRQREYSAYGQVGYSFRQGDNIWIREDYLRWFGSVDRMIQAGGAARLGRALLFLPSIGGTSKPHFRPNSQSELGLEIGGLPVVTPLASYRYYHYPSGNVRMILVGARVQPVGWANVEYRYGVSRNTDRTTTDNYSLRANAYLGEHLSPYLAYAHGVEDIPPQASAKVTYYSAGCVFDLTRSWGFRLDYTYEDRPLFYQHHTEGAGVTFKF